MSKFNDIIGVVLAGGKSQRMGIPKERIDYHGKQQMYHVADMLQNLGLECFISIPKDYNFALDNNYNFIVDRIDHIGPIGGIYSAFTHNKNKAIIFAAVDLPNISEDYLKLLLNSRKPGFDLVAFVNSTGQIEPVLSIWEGTAFPKIESAIGTGQYSLLRLIDKLNSTLLPLNNDSILLNVNDPKQMDDYLKNL